MKQRILALLGLLMTWSGLAFGGSGCATPTIVPSDGRIVDFDFVAPSGTNFYQFSAAAGRSYSVEVRQDYDDLQGTNDLTTTVSAANDGACAGGQATTDTTAIEPALPGNSFRGSFTATTTGFDRIKVVNSNAGVGRYVSVRVSETTIFNARWSTFSGFLTQYGFKNTTGTDIHGTLTLTDTLGSPPIANIAPIAFTIKANSESFKIAGANAAFDLNVPGQHGGFAVFTHDGPPGSLLVDAYFIGNNSTVIVPARFETVRQSH